MKKILKHFLNLKFLLCFGVSWLIVNGWSFIVAWVGREKDLGWLSIVGFAWAAILAAPNGFGVLVPLPLAFFFQKLFFPNDEALTKILREMREEKNKERLLKNLPLYVYSQIVIKTNHFEIRPTNKVFNFNAISKELFFDIYENDKLVGSLYLSKTSNIKFDYVGSVSLPSFSDQSLFKTEVLEYFKNKVKIAFIGFNIDLDKFVKHIIDSDNV